MGRRQYQVHRTSRRGSNRSSSSGLGCILIIILCAFLLVMLSALMTQFFGSSTGGTFVLVVIGLTVAYFLLRKRKRDQEKQAWLMQQQQQAAWTQYQRQAQLQRMEWERQENERRERERIAQMRSLGDILVLTPREFEQLVGKILRQNGIRDIQHVGGSGDLGVDLIGFDMHRNRIVVQCKRYAPGKSINSPDIQKFIGMMNVQHLAQKGIFVTTTTFTQPATDLAARHNILLIDGSKLIELLQGLQMNPH